MRGEQLIAEVFLIGCEKELIKEVPEEIRKSWSERLEQELSSYYLQHPEEYQQLK